MTSIVRLDRVSKSFWVTHEKPALVRQLLPRLVHPLRMERFWALRDLDLEVPRGTVLGVMGPNGAGKSTLLSVMAGVTRPSAGTVRIDGQVASLLTLGGGFQHELTGLENIFLNGSLLGMSTREIRRKREAIVAFSQLDGFIDAPLQTYSAGMKLRLGFAIAIHTEYDILVVDEVMSVGDAVFQEKCLEKFQAFKRQGRTLILAAQGTDRLRGLADRVLLMHQGRIIADGSVDHVQERYAVLTRWLRSRQAPGAFTPEESLERDGPGGARTIWDEQLQLGDDQIKDVRFVTATGPLVRGEADGRTGEARFARNVSKSFWVSHESPGLLHGLVPRLIRPLRRERFWALREVALDIPGGSTLGVIGSNGAGKTTLLGILSGITQPTDGTVTVRGKVVSLLTLGSGFHPELTGLENIFLNGSLLGMTTREIRRKLDAIVTFSQLDGFIDAPLSTYSAGMKLRLGFAIAAHTDFDILVVDEVMSVGDAAFQAKCREQLRAFKRAGKTLVIAAHNTDVFEGLVDRALLLHRGRIIADGTVDHVEERYAVLTGWLAPVQEPLTSVAQRGLEEQLARHDPSRIRKGWGQVLGTGEARIEQVRFLDAQGRGVDVIESGASLTVAMRFSIASSIRDPHIGVAIFRDDGHYCYGPNTRMDGVQFPVLDQGTYECRLRVDHLNLTPGTYRVTVSIWHRGDRSPYDHHMAYYPLRITGAVSEGIAILDRVWKQRRASAAGSAEVQRPRLTLEGPQGEQVWYRTFESLTLTAHVPAPPPAGTPTLRAECRGPRGELWWADRWTVPSGAAGAGMPTFELHFPQLALLTNRYHWTVGWASEAGQRIVGEPATAVTDVVADRADHGVLYLPHSWNLRAY